MKAPQDAKIESSIIGLNILKVKGVEIKCFKIEYQEERQK